jgi:hypothetical protein
MSACVVFCDPDYDRGANTLEFRLTYAGPLLAENSRPINNQKDRRRDHKHMLRSKFHAQIGYWWRIHPFLSKGDRSPKILVTEDSHDFSVDAQKLATRYAMYGFNFVPLVREELRLLCDLEVLFLRPGRPGLTMDRGDLDNRVKTLMDALSIPTANEDYSSRTPQADEKPFFCLLEDDKLITKLTIETDTLLEDIDGERHEHSARLIITVRLRPYEMHTGTLPFG